MLHREANLQEYDLIKCSHVGWEMVHQYNGGNLAQLTQI